MTTEFILIKTAEDPKQIADLMIETIKQATKKIIAERKAEQEIKKMIDWL